MKNTTANSHFDISWNLVELSFSHQVFVNRKIEEALRSFQPSQSGITLYLILKKPNATEHHCICRRIWK
jgi:hypothetical protein